jgi:hypothetical protein
MELVSMTVLRGAGNQLAVACVQVTPDIRVNGLRLVRNGSGVLRVFSPNANGCSVLSFSPAAVAELRALIVNAYQERDRHERAA